MNQHAARLPQRETAVATQPEAALVGAFDQDAQDLLDAVPLGDTHAQREGDQRRRVRSQEGARALRAR